MRRRRSRRSTRRRRKRRRKKEGRTKEQKGKKEEGERENGKERTKIEGEKGRRYKGRHNSGTRIWRGGGGRVANIFGAGGGKLFWQIGCENERHNSRPQGILCLIVFGRRQNVLPDCVFVLFSCVLTLNMEIAGSVVLSFCERFDFCCGRRSQFKRWLVARAGRMRS